MEKTLAVEGREEEKTRKLSPGHSRSRFLGTSTGSPRAQPVSFAASAFPVVSDTGRAFATRWKLRPSFGPFWVAPQFSLKRARFPTYTSGKRVREHARSVGSEYITTQQTLCPTQNTYWQSIMKLPQTKAVYQAPGSRSLPGKWVKHFGKGELWSSVSDSV
ncbi:hypothetical protein E6C27_scaffold538G00010 [Cucumis melo var. makuwa]|uniref:Uncharacterized protein n=1 Tax=Cucumis melo var. makuwa TaxID=1194695 RepID=A0A5A7VJF7_CUCMM|nr:hypothetical protein E6C27_scaffold538G00010 [Cucumis melo var. makuwa]